MSGILSNIGYMIGYVWGLMDNDMIPGLTFRQVFIYSWLLAIAVEFICNLGISFFLGEGGDE